MMIFGWSMDKNLDDFNIIIANMRYEGYSSRADIMQYLIERVKIAENRNVDLVNMMLHRDVYRDPNEPEEGV